MVDLATAPGATPSSAPFPEIAGPREESLVGAATLYASRTGRPLRVEAVSDPDDPDLQLYESGALLPGPHATLAGPTFVEWLESAAVESAA